MEYVSVTRKLLERMTAVALHSEVVHEIETEEENIIEGGLNVV